MSQSFVHLIVFALVAVLCICLVPGLHALPAENVTAKDSPSGDLLTNFTVQPTLGHGISSKDSGSESERVTNSTQPDQSSLSKSSNLNTQPPHSADRTHGYDQTNGTHSEQLDENTHHPIITNSTGSTTMGSTTMGSTTMGSTTMGSSTEESPPAGSKSDGSNKGAGIFVLILIFLIIIILAVVLYILWKRGKRYSFDLTHGEHDTPLWSMDQIGTFEQTKGSTTNLDSIQGDDPNKTSPVANGCSGETPVQAPCSEQQNEFDSFTSDSSLNSPVKKVEFNLDLELIGGEPELAKQATDEPTDNDNENNNNDTNAGNDPADLFTEINLDDTQ